MTLPELFRNLTGVLRYFATAVVGVCAVALFDRDHDAIASLVRPLWKGKPPAWAIIGALATLGLVTYFAHRVLVHRLLSSLIRRVFGRGWPPWGWLGSATDWWPRLTVSWLNTFGPRWRREGLRRARWVRRGTKEGKAARSVQNGLDEMNATAHLFYCSAWSAVVAWFVVSRAVTDLNVTAEFWVTFWVLLGVGFIADVQAASADVEEAGRV